VRALWTVGALVALALLPGTARAQAEGLQPDLRDGFEALEAWRFDRARDAATRIMERGDADPVTLAYLATVKLNHGDYAGAEALFREAEAAGAPAFLLRDLTTAQATADAIEGYVETVTDRFVLRHPPGRDAILVPFAEATLEAAMSALAPLLGFEPRGRTLVEVYPSAQTLSRVSTLTAEEIANSGTIALCKWNRLMITSPRGVVFGYAWRDTLAHELAHLLIGGASQNRAPIWLHEGLAKYVETAWRGEVGEGISVEQQERLRDAARSGELIPFSRMHPSMAKLPTQEQTSLAFAEVFTFVEFLVEKRAWTGVQRVLSALGEGSSVESAMRDVYGQSFAQLEEAWKAWVRERPVRVPPAAHVVKGSQPIVVKERPDTPDDELHGVPEEARRYARAADLLYARGRIEGAKLELQKAFRISPTAPLSAKLARVALQSGDLAAAEEAARKASEMSPHLAGPNVTLAEVLVRQDKKREAAVPLQRAIDVNPFDPRIHELTLAALGEDGDPERRAHARKALSLMEAPARPRSGGLGSGAMVRIEGPPFSRVYLSRDGGPFMATRALTPTAPFSVEPGTYEVRLLPPTGEPVQTRVVVKPVADPQTVQTVVAEPTGT